MLYSDFSHSLHDTGGGSYGYSYGGSGFDYDFVVDEGRLADVGSHMLEQADDFRTKVDELYKIIDEELAQSWQGPAYDSFKDVCSSYKQGLYELANMIDVFGHSAQEFSVAADDLLTDINNKFK